jgi:hypothetical protein
MMTLRHISAMLLCATAPTALLAEPVELRSVDGFNCTMVSVEKVNVPAQEVACYGAGCATAIADNDFGLTAAAFQNVVSQTEVAVAGGSDNITISFLTPAFDKVCRIAVGAYVTTGQTDANLIIGSEGEITLDDPATGEEANLRIADFGEPSNAIVTVASPQGDTPQAFASAAEWAQATALPDQMLATRAFAVIAATNIGIDSISMAELAGISAGEITNWSDLGGPDLRILPLQLPTTSSLRNEFIKLVMEPANKSIAGNVLTVADGPGIADSVNQFFGAVSVVEIADTSDNNMLPVSGTCGVPVVLDGFNVISGDYPLVRPLMVSYDSVPETQLTADIFHYATGAVTQGLIAAEGAAVTQSQAAQVRRMEQLLGSSFDGPARLAAAQMFQRLSDAQRLSPAMFKTLAEALAGSDMSGREIMFVGFGTYTNGAQAAFMQFAPDTVATNNLTLSSYGFGGISQATRYEGQVAASGHKRVEIWVK